MMTKVKLNLNQTHCCGIYSDKMVYSLQRIDTKNCFIFFKDVDLSNHLLMETFIVYDELRQYFDLPPYQKLALRKN